MDVGGSRGRSKEKFSQVGQGLQETGVCVWLKVQQVGCGHAECVVEPTGKWEEMVVMSIGVEGGQ